MAESSEAQSAKRYYALKIKKIFWREAKPKAKKWMFKFLRFFVYILALNKMPDNV